MGSQIRPHEAEKVGRRGQRDDRDPSCGGHGLGLGPRVEESKRRMEKGGDRETDRNLHELTRC